MCPRRIKQITGTTSNDIEIFFHCYQSISKEKGEHVSCNNDRGEQPSPTLLTKLPMKQDTWLKKLLAVPFEEIQKEINVVWCFWQIENRLSGTNSSRLLFLSLKKMKCKNISPVLRFYKNSRLKLLTVRYLIL